MEKSQTFNAPETKLHFLDYWRIIRLRKTVIIAVFLLVAITSTVVTFLLPETFASSARISVEKDTSDIPGLGYAQNSGGWDPFWMQSQFEKIQSKSMLYPVITNLGLQKIWSERSKEEGELRLDYAYQILRHMVEVSQPRNTSLMEIRVIDEDKDEAAKIANTIADFYKESRLARWNDLTRKGIKSLEEEWDKRNTEVKKAQDNVDSLKEKFGISDFESIQGTPTPTLEPDTLRKLETLRIEVQSEYRKTFALYSQLTNMSAAEFKKAIVTAVGDGSLAELMARLNLAEERMVDQEATLGPENSDVKKMRRVFETINRQLTDRLDGIRSGLKVKTEAERSRMEDIIAEVETYKTNEISTAISRRAYWQAKRDLESLQFVRERLTVRIIQEKVDASIPKTGIVEVIDPAEPAIKAIRPNKLLNIIMGVVFGLILGVGLAFFIEYLDTSVKTIDDVERALQVPVLGVIPQNVGALIFEGPDSPHAEAYRVLRTNIMFSLKDPKLNTVTIISAGAGEGKSTTIFNLATIFAQNGSRVLVVDSDLRRPSLHKILKVSNSIGLTNYLLKQNTLEEVIQTSSLPTLDFMPSGKLPSSSLGILNSAQMKDLIRELKRRYDYVFLDSPPIMGVSDASILASEVDCVLQVIQYRRYPQPMTIRAKQMIEKVGGNLIGIVLNNISMAADENYYYYSGYYYDYYSKNEESNPDKADDTKKSSGDRDSGIEIKPKY